MDRVAPNRNGSEQRAILAYGVYHGRRSRSLVDSSDDGLLMFTAATIPLTRRGIASSTASAPSATTRALGLVGETLLRRVALGLLVGASLS